MKKQRNGKGIIFIIFVVIICNVMIWSTIKKNDDIQKEEQRQREEIELRKDTEEFKQYLTYAILTKKMYYKSYYRMNLFLKVDENLDEFEKKHQEEWDVVEAQIDKAFSEEDVRNLSISSYDSYERGGVILSICAYNYDWETNMLHNKKQIMELSKGSKMFYYADVVNEIPKRIVNQYSEETYGMTYEEIVEKESAEYDTFQSCISGLYNDVCEDEFNVEEEQLIAKHIFILGSGEAYHSEPNNCELVKFEDLPIELQEMPKVQEIYKKYEGFKSEYEAKPEVQRFLDCTGREKENQEKLYEYNLENPELVNALCETLLDENVDTFDVSKQGSYFTESEQFEELVDEYLHP